ncbi:cell filamentation protein Fic [Aneurinibacillus migulanus]|uniref:Fic family protein n=1 Tax=Aneurinibacillus migulanus TaxID=47500 RepID=UPI0005BA3294|nr:Fic family protein [Aneurinibacillus migulanus]KIV56491.1 cell filamentation protein Fic [Aneurinibacillus migulanus]KPD09423.1 cell filamentation protein Fic [Aneurinibacillus migulanus]
MDFSILTQLKNQLDKHRPLPAAAVRNLKEVFRVEWTYNSNAIEGNTLSLMETKIVLEEGLTIGGKKLREHLEVINHAEAIDYIESLIEQQIDLDEKIIKDVHYLVLKGIDNENAGRYRQINVGISGSQHQPPHFLAVSEQMNDLLTWYHKQKDKLHPVELAALFHFKLVYIHPFSDGNGRTSRLLMNFILMSNGYPPAIVKAEAAKRIAYYQALETASINQETTLFIQLIAECVEESVRRYLNAVE